MTTDTLKRDAECPLRQPIVPAAPHAGSQMDDEPEPATEPMHEGP